ncbi:MAG: M28 family peptidase [Bacteroidales bacterium]|nr:M28 family peptidase [Bacteroidales bacterium]
MIIAACLLLLAGCKHKQAQPPEVAAVDYTQVAVPDFCADSAYRYTADQLAFGNRIPGSKAWQRCADYLVAQMRRWCDTVIVQDFRAILWDNSTVPGKNIIASFNPQAPRRILLAAHWDSRRWADHDADVNLQHSPVPGANDGAAGVATLMEMARVMSAMPPSVGVDFIFFDVEDQGVADWSEVYDEHSWCKGSQYWADNRHIPYYTAVYGVLFDMIGTPEPRFTKEYISRQYAPGLTEKLWQCAAALGYGNIFVSQNTDPILDDHLYVNQMAGIPMVDIVQNSPTTSFFTHWHTTTDDLQSVNAEALRIVATVTMKTLYGDYPAVQ